jgi:tetratricopeptide (TPR) repeat protein
VRNAALKLVEQHDIITVEPMSEADARTLLEKKLGKQEGDDNIAELVTELEFMPLAIVQAAAYISQRAPRCSVQEYLEEFRRSDRERATLLDFEGGQLRRDREAKNSIIITWQISFDHIRRIRPSASNLLSLMSFFDRQGIPEALVRNRAIGTEFCEAPISRHSRGIKHLKLFFHRNKNVHKGQIQDPKCRDFVDSFEDDVLILRNFSFISIDKDKTTFEMHRLVQLAIKRWLEAHGQRERWKHQFIVNLCSEIPTGKYENWAICQALFPHAKSAAAQKPENQESLKRWATILYRAAWYAEEVGNGAEAEEMSVAAMKARKKLLGREHEDTLWSMSLVGDAYNLRGQWSAAESLFVQVMEIRKSKLGVDHPDTLISMANLASTYRNQGRWEEAESLDVQVMETSKSKLGVDHPDTLTSMANLASTFWNQGRWEEAESLFVQVMETRKSKLGVDHPSTLTSMANLASTFWNQGRWEEAESLFVKVMETHKSKLGVDHPDTLTSMGSLASTYRNQGRWEEAESLEVQVMEASKSKLGVDHPSTLTSIANLASTFWNQGRWEEAESLEVQVMETRKSKLGVDHPDTLISMNNLAFTFKGKGNTGKAIGLMEECVRKQKYILGLDHPYTKDSEDTLNSWRMEGLALDSQSEELS